MVMLVDIDDMDVLHGVELQEAENEHAAAFNANWLQDLIGAGNVKNEGRKLTE